MARFALVKDRVTHNVIRLDDPKQYLVPDGFELVPEDLAAPMNCAWQVLLSGAQDAARDGFLDRCNYIDLELCENKERIDNAIAKSFGKPFKFEKGCFCLRSGDAFVMFQPVRPGVYSRITSTKGSEIRARDIVPSAIAWMFCNTDAEIIIGRILDMSSPMVEASYNAPGARELKPDRSIVGYSLLSWANEYGLDKARAEMAPDAPNLKKLP